MQTQHLSDANWDVRMQYVRETAMSGQPIGNKGEGRRGVRRVPSALRSTFVEMAPGDLPDLLFFSGELRLALDENDRRLVAEVEHAPEEH